MGALGIALLDQAIADFTSKHLFFVFSTDFLGRSVLGAEHHDLHGDVVAFERHLRFNGLLEGLGQRLWGVEDTTVVNVGDVHRKQVVKEFGLWRIHSDPSLASNPAHGHFGNAAQQSIVGGGLF